MIHYYFMYLIQIILLYLNKTKIRKKITKRPKLKDCDLFREIKSGDIVLYRFDPKSDIIGSIIGYFTYSPYSHCEVYVSDGWDISAEANGVTYVDLQSRIKKNKIDIFRLKGGLNEEQLLKIMSFLEKTVAYPYDYVNLGFFYLIKRSNACRFAGNSAYICSELVSLAYKQASIDLISEKQESIEAPADIARSDLLEYIGTYENGDLIHKDKRNEFLDFTRNFIGEIIFKILGVFTDADEFYRGLYENKKLLKGSLNG